MGKGHNCKIYGMAERTSALMDAGLQARTIATNTCFKQDKNICKKKKKNQTDPLEGSILSNF